MHVNPTLPKSIHTHEAGAHRTRTDRIPRQQPGHSRHSVNRSIHIQRSQNTMKYMRKKHKTVTTLCHHLLYSEVRPNVAVARHIKRPCFLVPVTRCVLLFALTSKIRSMKYTPFSPFIFFWVCPFLEICWRSMHPCPWRKFCTHCHLCFGSHRCTFLESMSEFFRSSYHVSLRLSEITPRVGRCTSSPPHTRAPERLSNDHACVFFPSVAPTRRWALSISVGLASIILMPQHAGTLPFFCQLSVLVALYLPAIG